MVQGMFDLLEIENELESSNSIQSNNEQIVGEKEVSLVQLAIV